MTITFTLPDLSFSPIVLILGIVTVVTLAFSYRVWTSDRKNPANIYFALFAFFAGLWAFGWFGFFAATSPKLWSVFVQACYITPTLAFPLFYLFTYYFPYKTQRFPTYVFVSIILATIFFITIFLIPDLFVASEVLAHNRFKPEVNPFLHILFGLYVVSVFLISYRNLIIKYKNADGIFRTRLKQVIKGTIVPFISGQVFSLTIPILYNNTLAWIGPVGLLYMSTYIWYHIFWHPSWMWYKESRLRKVVKVVWSYGPRKEVFAR